MSSELTDISDKANKHGWHFTEIIALFNYARRIETENEGLKRRIKELESTNKSPI